MKKHREPPAAAVLVTVTLAVADAVQRLSSQSALDGMLIGSTVMSIYLAVRYELWRRRNR